MTPAESREAEKLFGQILNLVQQGQPGKAERLAKSFLKKFPNDADFLRLLGLTLVRQARYTDAEKPLALSVKLAPQDAGAQELYGTSLLELGKPEQAEGALKKVIELNPSIAIAYPKLARALSMQGHRDKAQVVLDRMFALDPHKKDLLKAQDLKEQGDLREAGVIGHKILKENPYNFHAMLILGNLELEIYSPKNAEAFFQRVTQLTPDLAMGWTQLASSLNDQSNYQGAVEAYDRALAIDPFNSETQIALAELHFKWGKNDDARDIYEKAVERDPNDSRLRMAYGRFLRSSGDSDGAVATYKEAGRLDPHSGQMYQALASLKTYSFNPQEIAHMKRELEREDLEDSARVHICYALGKAYEDTEDYDQAFHYYKKASDQQRKAVDYSSAHLETMTKMITAVFTEEFLCERKGFGNQDDSPIFIVGLPRSGSTLIEQILSSHSSVDGTAELLELTQITSSLWKKHPGNVHYPMALNDFSMDMIHSFGADYIHRTKRYRKNAPYFTDKLLSNFMHVGFIHLILPNAKIIDARRHPLDSSFSSYKQFFNGQPFSYDLEEIAHYYTQYNRLMKHWDEVLPGKVLRVQYEDNVADQEGQARRILEHCGLEWEDRVLRFYETKRSVQTVSSEQVRQPIYNKSVNTWKRFEGHLKPLTKGLKPVLDELPEHLDRPE